MVRDYTLRVRLNQNEKLRLQAEADNRGVSMSEVIQDYIKGLPHPKKNMELLIDGTSLAHSSHSEQTED